MNAIAAACTANGGFGDISWPGAIVIVAFILGGAWVAVKLLR